jgi:hypothetical protein
MTSSSTESMAGALAPRWAEVEPLQVKAESKGGGGARMKRTGARRRKRAAGKERRETEMADAKWRGKRFTPPSPTIYRSRGAVLPKTTCDARINCRGPRLPLTDGPHRAETAGCARMRDHYGAATDGPRCPVTSPPPRHPLRMRLRRLKRRARRARLRSFNGPIPYRVRVTPARP